MGTWARAPLAFDRFFLARLHVETSCLVWFGTVPSSNSALFVQPFSLWNDAITGYKRACAKTVFTARRVSKSVHLQVEYLKNGAS